jgi:hypothetical protein
MSFSFHQLYRQFPGIFDFKNIPTSALANKAYSGKKPLIASQGVS